MRPAQWVKNLVLPLPFLFGGALATARGWWLAAAGLLVFCAVTSAVYLVNDVMDRESDRRHPTKGQRPIAAGDLPVSVALGAAAVIGTFAITAAFMLGWRFGVVAAAYLARAGLEVDLWAVLGPSSRIKCARGRGT